MSCVTVSSLHLRTLPQGPSSLKQNGVFTFVITSGRTDLTTPHTSHTSQEHGSSCRGYIPWTLRSLQTPLGCSKLGSSCRRYGGFPERGIPSLLDPCRVLLAEHTSNHQHANTRNQTQPRPRTVSQKLITLFTPRQTHHACHAPKNTRHPARLAADITRTAHH